MSRETLPTYCPQCVSRCGCLATVEDGRLLQVEPDPLHPTGGICIKARVAPEVVGHPARLTVPLLRTRPKGDADPGWRPIPWDEALALAGSQLKAAGPAATAFAVATPSGTAIADSFGWIHRLARAWGSSNLVFATENCNWHRDFTPALTWGKGLGMPDYARARTILLWGCNPAATWPAHAARISAARQRGARLIVVDPRQAGFARGADLWLPVRPGTDAALALGLIHLLLSEGGADLAFLQRHSDAFERLADGRGTVLEQLAEQAAAWPPERVAAVTGVGEVALRRAADWLGSARPVSLYTWTGTCQQEAATAATRAINILYALTGSLGQPGGNRWFPKPCLNDVARLGGAGNPPPTLGLAERPLGPPSRGWVTSRDLYRAISRGEPYPIRALVAFGGNFLVSKPATARADEALAKLDFFVQTELFETPTARWADLLLPAASGWEREGLQAGFLVDEAAEAHVQLRPAVARPPGEARSDTAIIFDLARELGLAGDFFGADPEAGLAWQLAPSGLDAAALRGQRRGLAAPSLGKEGAVPRITLWSEDLDRACDEPLPAYCPPCPDSERPFVLTCGKTVPYLHSQFRQVESLRRRQPEPRAELAPDVAVRCGIRAGDAVVIGTAAGELHCRADINPRLAAGTVWAQYGWWHPQAEVNYNACADQEQFDRVSGSNALRGIPCQVRRQGESGA